MPAPSVRCQCEPCPRATSSASSNRGSTRSSGRRRSRRCRFSPSASACGCCSSARTPSPCSRSRCAARTTGWPGSTRRKRRAGWSPPRPATTRRGWRSPPGVSASGRSSSCRRRRPRSRWTRCGGSERRCSRTGSPFDEANARAYETAQSTGRVYVHPFDDPDVIAGQGTVGMEILRQTPETPHAIFVPVGGGGLIAGIAAYVKPLWPGGADRRGGAGGVRLDARGPRGGPSGAARRGGALRGRGGGAAGRRGASSHRAPVRGRGGSRDHRRDVRRDPGHLPEHADDRRAGGRARGRGRQALRGARGDRGRAAGRHRQRRQRQLRPPAPHRGARGGRGAARDAARGHHTRAGGQPARVLPLHRRALRHRVQLPLRR